MRKWLRDDRGRGIRRPAFELSGWVLAPPKVRADLLLKRARFSWSWLPLALAVGAICVWIVRSGSPGTLTWIVLVGLSAPLGEFYTRLTGTPAQTLVSLGRCGSCGYPLESLKTEGDGCVVCAECGAAWKRYRMLQRDPEHWPPSLPQMAPLTPRGVDDRGVWTIVVDATTAHLVYESEQSLSLARQAIAQSSSRRRMRTSLTGVGIFVASVFVLFVTGGSSWAHWLGVPAVFGAICGCLLLVGGLLVMAPWPRRRTVILAVGHCPCCLCGLAGLGAEEDGCVICKRCRSAWRAGDIGTPPEFCLNCGYSFEGIKSDRCPECGFTRYGRSLPPRPPGHPHRARCGHDMEGREENRTCPECGVMYGIEYRE